MVTCGGLQSAHTVAVAAACAERGRRAHLLVRGERPDVPTGHHLYARMLAHRVEYITRAEYADRAAMFAGYLQQLQRELQAGDRSSTSGSGCSGTSAYGISDSSSSSSSGVAVIPEGAACSAALLGLVRLVAWLAQHTDLGGGSSSSRANSCDAAGGSEGGSRRVHIFVDSGTGVTATGEQVGSMPGWRVNSAACGAFVCLPRAGARAWEAQLLTLPLPSLAPFRPGAGSCAAGPAVACHRRVPGGPGQLLPTAAGGAHRRILRGAVGAHSST